ncbi:piggyBac transposable element-derived protein 1-like [Melitaea cinxia]|uniref:piggyBac transposable element-derived protein 1-like n=1 Tax=Melitaea cinxia TaxID=113334 RepID=UPI001E271B26|nr:piggyBac transposable element-derived protein 1-like [Melitaea cinxia]
MNKNLDSQQIERLLNDFELDESENDTIFPEILSDLSDAEDEVSVHDTESDESADSTLENEEIENIEQQNREANAFYGKNRYKWAKAPPSQSRVRAHNIILHLPGLRGPAQAKNKMTPLDAWQCLFTDDILDLILEHTNEKITMYSEKNTCNSAYTDHLSKEELCAFIGLMFLSGIFKSGREDARGLWSSKCKGRPIFRTVMSLNRYLFILSCLRFDEEHTREERKQTDRLALISEVFNKFIKNCISNYSCSEYVTVDEMLVPFRGRCLFRIYMKSKPAKYGLKIMCLCDAKTHYLFNAFIYSGKEKDLPANATLIPTRNVMKLAEPIYGTNRNITGDNWFSSIELIDALMEKNLTYVGTIRKNKKEIPPQFLPHRNRVVLSSLYGFQRNKTLLSFVPKKNVSVTLVSSMHHAPVTNPETKKPEIIDFYNSTKGGVDALDQKCAAYSVNRRCQRWPTTIFCSMLNISGVNSHVLYSASNPHKYISRYKFLEELGYSLVTPHVLDRRRISNLSRELKGMMDKFLREVGAEIPEDQPKQGPSQNKRPKKSRCHLCPRSKDSNTPRVCSKCMKNVCRNHSIDVKICTECET